jgi:hypothetical protein
MIIVGTSIAVGTGSSTGRCGHDAGRPADDASE